MKPKSLICKGHRPTPQFVRRQSREFLLATGSPADVAPQRDFRGQRRPDCQE